MAAKALGRRILACWGNSDFGRLGLGIAGATIDTTLPQEVAALAGQDVVHVAAGGAHTLAVTTDGTVWAMGLNDAGQLGHGGEDAVLEPVIVPVPEDITQVAAGSHFSLMLADSGRVWAMGDNADGQLGLGGAGGKPEAFPRRINALADVQITAVAAGAQHAAALSKDGQLFTWGASGQGRLGHPTRSDWGAQRRQDTPILLRALGDSHILSVAAGLMNTACLDANGTVRLCGPRLRQLVTQGHAEDPVPVPVAGLHAMQQVALGGRHALALRQDGRVVAWGANMHGELGLGRRGMDQGAEPSAVAGLQDVAQVAAGWQHSASVTTEGELWTWGWGGHVPWCSLSVQKQHTDIALGMRARSVGTESVLNPAHRSAGGQLGLDHEFDTWEPAQVQRLALGGQEYNLSAGNVGAPRWRFLQVSCGFNHTAAVVEVTLEAS